MEAPADFQVQKQIASFLGETVWPRLGEEVDRQYRIEDGGSGMNGN